jgi:hypothetical protein
MHIGQILWFINGENQSVVPVKIVEKVTKETITGVQTEFIVETASGKRSNLTSINGPYFEQIEQASEHLRNAANELINRVIAKAQETAKKFQVKSEALDEQPIVQNVAEPYTMDQVDDSFITLPDGRQAKVRIKA